MEKGVPKSQVVSVALVAALVETEMMDSVDEEEIARLQMAELGGKDFPTAAMDATMGAMAEAVAEAEATGGEAPAPQAAMGLGVVEAVTTFILI